VQDDRVGAARGDVADEPVEASGLSTMDDGVAADRMIQRHHEQAAGSVTVQPVQPNPVGEAVVNYGRPLDAAAPAVVAPTETTTPVETTVSSEVTGSPVPPPVDSTADTVPAPAPASDAGLDAGIADAFAEGWFSDPTANAQVALWGIILALIGLGSYLLSRRVKRDWVGALVGIVPYVIALYFFFQNVNRLLPPNL
jgi:sortase A